MKDILACGGILSKVIPYSLSQHRHICEIKEQTQTVGGWAVSIIAVCLTIKLAQNQTFHLMLNHLKMLLKNQTFEKKLQQIPIQSYNQTGTKSNISLNVKACENVAKNIWKDKVTIKFKQI